MYTIKIILCEEINNLQHLGQKVWNFRINFVYYSKKYCYGKNIQDYKYQNQ